MPKVQIQCPQCRQPLLAEVRQVFDVGEDPRAKALLLSGAANVAQCPNCGYQGPLATPIVYHDPDKELLLVYTPPELGLHRDQQEKVVGPLLNQIINRLPPEKRKAYLLQPQTMLSFESMVERILEADGITKEMLQAQEARLRLIRRLANASGDDVRKEILRQEANLVDETFFALLARLAEVSLAAGDEIGLQRLSQVERLALEHTPYGQQLKQRQEAVKAALQALDALGPRPTMDQLVDIFVQHDGEDAVQALARLLRPALNYLFFDALTKRLEAAQGEERERLSRLRQRLLEITEQLDKEAAARVEAARQLLEQLLQAEDLEAALRQILPYLDELFLAVAQEALQTARQKGDLERSARISRLLETLEQLTAPPPEVVFLQELLDTPDPAARRRLLEQKADLLNEQVLNTLANLVAQYENRQDIPAEARQHLRMVYQEALRFSMQRKMAG